ncbi:hypothetical protein AHiyo6_33690 [Arthrobacter sp. Hiyo6]|nr:hypothetical protein AHiyo6_33690 [Arthrobacter sp. Hiyo6]
MMYTISGSATNMWLRIRTSKPPTIFRLEKT